MTSAVPAPADGRGLCLSQWCCQAESCTEWGLASLVGPLCATQHCRNGRGLPLVSAAQVLVRWTEPGPHSPDPCLVAAGPTASVSRWAQPGVTFPAKTQGALWAQSCTAPAALAWPQSRAHALPQMRCTEGACGYHSDRPDPSPGWVGLPGQEVTSECPRLVGCWPRP